MNFDGSIREYGYADISALRENIHTLDFSLFAEDQLLRQQIAPGREGRSIWFLRPYIGGANFAFTRPNPHFEKWQKIHCHFKYIDTQIFSQVIDLVKKNISSFYPNATPYNIQLAELPAKSKIEMHTDGNILVHSHRLHIPIITNENVIFQVKQKVYYFKEGCVFELNNTYGHGVRNESSESRFHLICDLLPHEKGRVIQHPSPKEHLEAIRKEI